MMWIFLFMVLMVPTVLGSANFEMRTISTWLGSDLYIPVPELCNSSHDFLFDVCKASELIGLYHGSLKGRNGYAGRLYFNKENCTITLTNLTKDDVGSYKIKIRKYVNQVSDHHDVDFNISLIDHVTSAPLPTDMVTNSTATACDLGFWAVCISLAPSINILIDLIYLHSCWSSCVTQRCRDIVLRSCGVVSLVCQIFVISFWGSCGISNSLLWFILAVFCMAILFASRILPLFKCINIDDLGKKERCGLMLIFFLLQLGFTTCVLIAFSPTHGQIIVQKIWIPIIFSLVYLVAFTFTLPGIVGKVYHSYCRPRTPEEAENTEMEKMNPTENDSSIKQTEKSSPLPV